MKTKKVKKKKRSYTRKGAPKGHRAIYLPKEHPGHEPRAIFEQPPRTDPEDDALEPKDKIAKHKYPPPRKEKMFREFWAKYIDNISNRKNFHTGHLEPLRVLCDLLVEYEYLHKFLRERGYGYVAYGRQGEQHKLYPQVGQLNKVKEGIKQYSALLDLVGKKDDGKGGGTGDEDGWGEDEEATD